MIDLSTNLRSTANAGAPEKERLAGSLFAIDTSIAGMPENRFAL